MREAALFLILVFLIIIGWNQSYQDHWLQLLGRATPVPAGLPAPPGAADATSAGRAAPAPATPRDSRWMWSKGRMAEPHSQSGR